MLARPRFPRSCLRNGCCGPSDGANGQRPAPHGGGGADLHAPGAFADFSAGADRALDLALTHTTDAEAYEIDEARIFYYERPG